MAGDVNIVIEAQDKASVVLEKVAKKTEENVKQIRETGDASKKSTELVGSFANALGDTGLGSYAAMFADLTDKAASFSETMEEGAGNSTAFKAGLAGLVGVIAFSLGNAIGNLIFQTDKWAESLEDANNKAKELADTALSSLGKVFNEQVVDIELIRDPEAKKAAYRDLFNDLDANVVGLEEQVKAQRLQVEAWNEAWQITGERKATAEQEQQRLEAMTATLKQVTAQREEIRLLTSEKQAERDAQREANAEAAKADSYIDALKDELELLKAKKSDLNEIAAANNTVNLSQATYVKQLLDERDALKAEEERVKSLEKITEELKKQLAVETYGAEEAKRREQLAVAATDEERKRLEALQDLIDKQKEHNDLVKSANEEIKKQEDELAKAREERNKEQEEINKKKDEFEPGQQAVESRLLTRGPQQKAIDNIADYTKKTVATLERMEEQLEQQKQKTNTLELEMVG